MFIQRPLSNKGGKPRQLVQGHGINDATYVTGYTDSDGKKVTCPYYATWSGMLERVYSPKFHTKNPTYIDCTVEDSWKSFSVFRTWMEMQNWQEMCLDKDLLILGNKHYGPDTCIFIPRTINSMLVLRENYRGDYPLGVTKSAHKGYTYYVARCSFYGKFKHLGTFKTPEEASECYLIAKRAHIIEVANTLNDVRTKNALLNFKDSL